MWIAAGNLYLYSYNGITWIDISGSQQYFYNTFGIAFNNKRPNTITFPTNSLIGSVSILPGTTGSIVLNPHTQLDVVCDSYYNTGFTNCSISIKS
jgi:hypothetical protein